MENYNDNRNDATYYRDLGNAALRDGNIDDAIVNFEKATDLNPHMADAWCGLGRAFGVLREYDSALSMYRRAYALNHNYRSAVYGIALTLKNMGRYGDAQKYCDEYDDRFGWDDRIEKVQNAIDDAAEYPSNTRGANSHNATGSQDINWTVACLKAFVISAGMFILCELVSNALSSIGVLFLLGTTDYSQSLGTAEYNSTIITTLGSALIIASLIGIWCHFIFAWMTVGLMSLASHEMSKRMEYYWFAIATVVIMGFIVFPAAFKTSNGWLLYLVHALSILLLGGLTVRRRKRMEQRSYR